MSKKLLRDRSNIDPETLAKIERQERQTGPKGLYGQFMFEPIPSYAKAGAETVFQGNNNSFIVLGRDRAGNNAEGLGGMGATNCGMIDLIAGLDSINVSKPYKNPNLQDPAAVGENMAEAKLTKQGYYAASPSFFEDAARLYLTQKGDVDYYFGLAKGSEGADGASKNRSAAALKADQTIFLSR